MDSFKIKRSDYFLELYIQRVNRKLRQNQIFFESEQSIPSTLVNIKGAIDYFDIHDAT